MNISNFHMIHVWKSPIKLPVELPVELLVELPGQPIPEVFAGNTVFVD